MFLFVALGHFCLLEWVREASRVILLREIIIVRRCLIFLDVLLFQTRF